MQIKKIDSRYQTPTSGHSVVSSSPFLLNTASSLSSISEARSPLITYFSHLGRGACIMVEKAFSCIKALFLLPGRAVKLCLEMLFPSKSPPEDTHLDFIPKTLGSHPLLHLLFAEQPDGKIALNSSAQEHAKLTAHLFSTLAACTSIPKWIWHASSSKAAGRAVKKAVMHPLAFLYFTFMNRQATENYFQFQKNSQLVSPELAKRLGAIHPLEDSMNSQIGNFQSHGKADILKMLPGFCHLLKLDLVSLRVLAQKEKWQEFIVSVNNQCKKNHKI